MSRFLHIRENGVGLAVFGLDFAISTYSISKPSEVLHLKDYLQSFIHFKVLFDLLLIGFFGGLFCVPLYTRMQQKSAVEIRSQVIASNNIVNAFFMVVGSLVAGSLLGSGWSMAMLFGATAVLHIVAMAWLVWKNPEYRKWS